MAEYRKFRIENVFGQTFSAIVQSFHTHNRQLTMAIVCAEYINRNWVNSLIFNGFFFPPSSSARFSWFSRENWCACHGANWSSTSLRPAPIRATSILKNFRTVAKHFYVNEAQHKNIKKCCAGHPSERISIKFFDTNTNKSTRSSGKYTYPPPTVSSCVLCSVCVRPVWLLRLIVLLLLLLQQHLLILLAARQFNFCFSSSGRKL